MTLFHGQKYKPPSPEYTNSGDDRSSTAGRKAGKVLLVPSFCWVPRAEMREKCSRYHRWSPPTRNILVTNHLCPHYLRPWLFRSDPIQESRNQCKDYIRQPQGDARRQSARVDEHLAESEEKDIGEGQGYSDTDVPTYSTSTFLG